MNRRRKRGEPINDIEEEFAAFVLPITLDEAAAIEQFLALNKVFVAHFSEDPAVVYSISKYLEQEAFHETTTRMLIDRQVVSFIKQIATGAAISDKDRKMTAAILCFARLARFEIEPNIAVYEYADHNGYQSAWRDACIVKHSLKIDFSEWYSLFTGAARTISDGRRFTSGAPLPPEPVEFQRRLRLFSFCLTYLLRQAVLARSKGKPLDKMLRYLDWMHQEFFYSNSGLLFGSNFLSPKRRKNMIRNIDSTNLSKVLAGIRNACWDMTFIEQWLKYTKQHGRTPYLWIACSVDVGLLQTARRVFVRGVEPGIGLRSILQQDWGHSASEKILEHLSRLETDRDSQRRAANGKLPSEHWVALRERLMAQL